MVCQRRLQSATLLPLQCLVVFKVVLCAIRLIPTTVFNSHDMFYCFPLVSKKTEAQCRSPLEQLLLWPTGTETTCLDSGFRDPSLQGLLLSTVPTPYKSPYSSPPHRQSISETVTKAASMMVTSLFYTGDSFYPSAVPSEGRGSLNIIILKFPYILI